MTAPLLLGVPSAAHREALLRETAGGGRVPVAVQPCHPDGHPHHPPIWHMGSNVPGSLAPPWYPPALILSHSTDPEAGAMGLARLAWVGLPAGVALQWGPPIWRVSREIGMWFVRLDWGQDEDDVPEWGLDNLPALRDATNAAHAIGLVCVHLGLLERVERVEVPHGG